MDQRRSKGAGQPLGVCKVPLSRLLDSDDMTLSSPFALRESGQDATVTLHLCLRVWTRILLPLIVCHYLWIPMIACNYLLLPVITWPFALRECFSVTIKIREWMKPFCELNIRYSFHSTFSFNIYERVFKILSHFYIFNVKCQCQKWIYIAHSRSKPLMHWTH